MNKKYILFDLDGTLTDPMIGITSSVQYALKHFNIMVEDLNSLCKFIGPPLKESFMEYYNFNNNDAEMAVAEYRKYFSDIGIFQNFIYDDISELLKILKDNNKILILATSKPTVFAEKILIHFNLEKYFDCIVGSNLDGTRSKKVEVINYVLEQNNIINLNDAIMIGDRKYDILGATEAGIESIGVLYGYGDYEELYSSGANYIAKDVKQLLSILTK